jgi:hypothetical protein
VVVPGVNEVVVWHDAVELTPAQLEQQSEHRERSGLLPPSLAHRSQNPYEVPALLNMEVQSDEIPEPHVYDSVRVVGTSTRSCSVPASNTTAGALDPYLSV